MTRAWPDGPRQRGVCPPADPAKEIIICKLCRKRETPAVRAAAAAHDQATAGPGASGMHRCARLTAGHHALVIGKVRALQQRLAPPSISDATRVPPQEPSRTCCCTEQTQRQRLLWGGISRSSGLAGGQEPA